MTGLMVATILASAAGLTGHGRVYAADAAGTVDSRPTGALAAGQAGRAIDAAHGARQADISRLRESLDLVRRGRIRDADQQAAGLRDPVARQVAEWAVLRLGLPHATHARLRRFLDHTPERDWPARGNLLRRLEEALLAERHPAELVRASFSTQPPRTTAGRIALARALDAQDDPAGLALARQIWRSDALTGGLEARLLATFGPRLTAQDHRDRLEWALFTERSAMALKLAATQGEDVVRYAQARLAVARKAPDMMARVSALPSALANDPGALFARAQAARRQGDAATAARLLEGLVADAAVHANGDAWWTERRLIARQLLDQGRPGQAYAVASQHHARGPQARMEAEWHAGWIALRFLDDPARALGHFETAATIAETPISVARAAYWSGRAAEALGDGDGAHGFFTRAARHPVAFYGQLARAKLGWHILDTQRAETPPLPVSPALDAVRWLIDAHARDLARGLILELARVLGTPQDVAELARLAAGLDEPALLVSLGKIAVQRGLPLMDVAWPDVGLPAKLLAQPLQPPVEQAMLWAISRQESAFNPAATSPAGARGLMQLMPATARETARRVGLDFALPRLIQEPAYNTTLGAAHLAELVARWQGCYVLSFAAYNAGPGHVRNWIDSHGDPRDPAVDMIDWIERIPFSETRHYVQRVLENLQIYRARLGHSPMLAIARDLNRASRSHPSLRTPVPATAARGPQPGEPTDPDISPTLPLAAAMGSTIP